MWPRLRQPAMIAVFLLASILLSQDTATSSVAPAKAPATQVHHRGGAAAQKTARRAQPQSFCFANVQQLAHELAARHYRLMTDALTASLAFLNLDQYPDTRF